MNMQAQMIRLLAAEVPPHNNILKQVEASQRRQIFQAFDRKVPLLIDYGSETTKVGYQSFKMPNLVFRPQISKTRDPNKSQLPIKSVMNLSYDQLDITKSTFKTPFQKNLLLHFSILEQCNDYIFSQLLRPGQKLPSPLLISQPFANPVHCRQSTLGQLFQCYGIGEVLVGVGDVFGYFYELDCDVQRFGRETAVVVSVGAWAVHVWCVVQGRVEFGSVRRINVGGNNAFQLFSRTLLLKNPQLKSKLTYPFLRDLYETYTKVSHNYIRQLRHFQHTLTSHKSIKQPLNPQLYHNLSHEHNRAHENPAQENGNLIQVVEIDFDVLVQVPEEEIRRKEEMKIRMAEKLRETIQRRKELKRKLHQHELRQLVELKEKYEGGDKEAHQEVVEMFGTSKFFDKLLKKIHSLQLKLGLTQQKPQQNKFSLIEIPDHELTSQKLKLKRIQLYQKNMLQAKKKKQQEKMLEEQKMKDLRENNPQLYLQQLKEKYRGLAERAKENQRIKNQLNSRKSRLKQKRMQVLARLAEEDYDENNIENQQDMQALKDPQQSDHYSQLEVMQAELREIDPEWNSTKKDIHHLNSSNKLFLSVQLIKCHQIYFQPRIVGCQQAGLIETIKCSLEQFEPGVRERLLGNIVVIGGGAQVPGLKGRMEKELRQEMEAGLGIGVRIGKGGYLGTYLGMQGVARLPRKDIAGFFYQSSQFNQNQPSYFIPNPWSNPKPNLN